MDRRSCKGTHGNPEDYASECPECRIAWFGLAAPEISGLDRCVHRGGELRRQPCTSCPTATSLAVFGCKLHKECTPETQLPGIAFCRACPDHRSSWSLVAPLGTTDVAKPWEGRAAKKPWDYRSTAILPHINTPELLEVVIDLLRLQTEPPYIVVVDTGSPPAVCDRLERLRYDDCEIHFVRSNGYTHSSEPVCVALDLGFARVNTDLTFLTHTDCFPTKRNALAWLGDQCNAACPVIGWQMSDRSWATGEWQGLVSHTFTMLHSETMRRVGATWHMQRGRDFYGYARDFTLNGWPDTETSFGAVLKKAGIVPKLLGAEPNHVRQVTDWWDHARSTTGRQLYSLIGTEARTQCDNALKPVYEAAVQRVADWKRELGRV